MPSRPLPDLPGVYYSIIEGIAELRPSDNVLAVQQVPAVATGSADVGVADDVALFISNRWSAFATAVMPQAYTNTQVKTYPLHTPTAPASVHVASNVGGVIGDIAVMTAGALINHTVYRRGKGSQSRTTLTPVNQVKVTADGKSLIGGWPAAIDTAWTTFITDILTDLTTAHGGSWTYVQMSKGTIAHAPATYLITASGTESLLSSQKRRGPR